MTNVQVIQHGGRAVAAVIGADQAVMSESLPSDQEATVHRMCLYGLEIAAGTRPGPNRDEDAEGHAIGAS